MRASTPCCHTFVAFILKFMNFLQTFVGIAMILYSAFMMNQWQHQHDGHHKSPPPAPSPHASPPGIELPVVSAINPLSFASEIVLFERYARRANLHSLPAPWFVYAFMGLGILVCCITCIGYIAAELINGCCLCFYAILTTIFILLEMGLVGFIALDRQWEKDLPFDPTGQLVNLRSFIKRNMDVFIGIGIAILTIQALSLVLAIILRSLVSSQREDDDTEEDNNYRNRTRREPLLNNGQSSQPSVSTRGDSDIWSSRMRQKYGLNSGEAKPNSLLNKNATTDVKKSLKA